MTARPTKGSPFAVICHLTDEQLERAREVGRARYRHNVRHGARDRHGAEQDSRGGEALCVMGAVGEAAVANWLGLDWYADTNYRTRHRNDLPLGIEVRSRSVHWGELIVRDGDDDYAIYVLITGSPETGLQIQGWRDGASCKQPQYRQAYGGRPPAYFVPASELYEPETLIEFVRDSMAAP